MDILLHRHLVWTVVDASVWQPSVPQFSAPASLEVGRSTGDISSDCETNRYQKKHCHMTRHIYRRVQLKGGEAKEGQKVPAFFTIKFTEFTLSLYMLVEIKVPKQLSLKD